MKASSRSSNRVDERRGRPRDVRLRAGLKAGGHRVAAVPRGAAPSATASVRNDVRAIAPQGKRAGDAAMSGAAARRA